MYVVIENTPGYLPENDDPATFENLDEAREYLIELVARYTNEYSENGGYVYRESWADDKEWCCVTFGEHRGYQHERVFEIVTDE
jgi:hypothetical protein